MAESSIGAATIRREDPPLIQGQRKFIDDIQLSGALHTAFLRSSRAHARVVNINVEAALAHDSVVDVVTAESLAEAGGPTVVKSSNSFTESGIVERPLLADDRVRFTGDPIALVLAEDPYAAHAALDDIVVEYEPLTPFVDPGNADSQEYEPIADSGPDTFEWDTGDKSAVDSAIAEADTVVSLQLENQRLFAAPMEPRGYLASCENTERDDQILTIWSSTQTPHKNRTRIAETLGLQEEDVRVIAPAVGGGFGAKGSKPFSEEILVAWASMEYSRPVKWTATRSEELQTTHHGRNVHTVGELALTEDGIITALRVNGYVGVGAFPYKAPKFCLRPHLLAGPYEIPEIYCQVTGVLTNTTPIGSYRGAGRPEAIYVVERLMDRAAKSLGIDPVELRRRNFIPPDSFPYETTLGYTYDSGDYEPALDLALDTIGYDSFRETQSDLLGEGRYVGIGISSFVENTGSSGAGNARIEIDETGQITVYNETADHGQGHETTFAQIVSDQLGVPEGDITIVEGDTNDLPEGIGTYGSRSVPVGGSTLVECSNSLIEKATPIAARELEVSIDDVEFTDGVFHPQGVPDRSVALTEIPRIVEKESTNGDSESVFSTWVSYEPEGRAYSFGTHIAMVEVYPDAGELEILRYVGVDDCGVQINPLLVESQVEGGVVQGLGQAVLEHAMYNENGTLVTGSFQDYAMPRAHHVPEMETDSTVTPAPWNPLGAKGVGESGTIAAPPAIVNAVIDALEPFGVSHIDMPVSPNQIWAAIHGANDRV